MVGEKRAVGGKGGGREERESGGSGRLERAGTRTSKNVGNPEMIRVDGLYNGFQHFHMRIRCKTHHRFI